MTSVYSNLAMEKVSGVTIYAGEPLPQDMTDFVYADGYTEDEILELPPHVNLVYSYKKRPAAESHSPAPMDHSGSSDHDLAVAIVASDISEKIEAIPAASYSKSDDSRAYEFFVTKKSVPNKKPSRNLAVTDELPVADTCKKDSADNQLAILMGEKPGGAEGPIQSSEPKLHVSFDKTLSIDPISSPVQGVLTRNRQLKSRSVSSNRSDKERQRIKESRFSNISKYRSKSYEANIFEDGFETNDVEMIDLTPSRPPRSATCFQSFNYTTIAGVGLFWASRETETFDCADGLWFKTYDAVMFVASTNEDVAKIIYRLSVKRRQTG